MPQDITRCQIFTPPEIVKEILDQVGYTQNLYNKKVLENSCGDGAFLFEIVDRYIVDGLNNKLSLQDIIKGLEQDIYGMEIDEVHYNTCLNNLNKLCAQYKIFDVNWNILLVDSLQFRSEYKFDFIIGNPPYITYSQLLAETRQLIKNNFITCKQGKPDLYYAFIENSICNLAEKGKLAYLIPNNVFKNRFADKLRQYILPYLVEIIDYRTQKLFSNKLVSSAVIICENNNNTADIKYTDKECNTTRMLSKENLVNKWVFSKPYMIEKRNEYNDIRQFSDDFKIMCSIATLCNKVFIITDYIDHANSIETGEYTIEKNILKQAVSPRSCTLKRLELLIFPYYYVENKLHKYSEKEFIQQFPNAYKYFENNRQILIGRTSDKNAKIFEYGRSQSLEYLNQDKLLISTMITKKVKVHKLNKDQIPYAGIMFFPKTDLSLDIAEKILASAEFLQYVNGIGINASGGTMRITAQDVKLFTYSLKNIMEQL